jgi:poly-gamma-glutamate capsule biosynthesis protein CapA/YwtB (metallophosphatase superfamily)
LILHRRGFLSLAALGIAARRSASGVPTPEPGPHNRLLFGGDVMLARYVGRLARQKGDSGWPLRELAPLLSSADIAFVNLESPFSDRGRPVEKGMVFKAEPEMIEALLAAGIDAVSTANNHTRDFGAHGVEFTLDWLAKHGIAAVGTGATSEIAHQGVVLERHGVRFGFLGYTYDQANGNHTDRDDRVSMMNVDEMTRDIKNIRERADVAIVSMHAGVEYRGTPNAEQRKFAHAAIDAGAKVVVGHHPHVTQQLENYSNGLIFYSLGNLVFDQMQRKDTQVGWIADVRFAGERIAGYGVIPVDIVRTSPRVHSPALSRE